MAITKGNKIKLEYEGRFEDGTIFDSSRHGDHSHPLEFVVGDGQVIPGFDNSVLGMDINQEKEFSIEPKDAYGERNEMMVQKVPRSNLPPKIKPEVGMVLGLNSPDGRQIPVPVVAVSEEEITLDMNHPLAGKKLIFKIKILEIN
jgi:peptidylprolyl isomerase